MSILQTTRQNSIKIANIFSKIFVSLDFYFRGLESPVSQHLDHHWTFKLSTENLNKNRILHTIFTKWQILTHYTAG